METVVEVRKIQGALGDDCVEMSAVAPVKATLPALAAVGSPPALVTAGETRWGDAVVPRQTSLGEQEP